MKIISRKEALEKGLDRYFTGKSCKEGHIAERYVSGRTCIKCSMGKEEKIKCKPSKPSKVTKKIEEKLLTLYNSGTSAEEISRKIGLGATTVRRYLKWNKIKTRSVKEAKGGLTDEQEINVKKLYDSGLTTTTIGKKYGVSSNSIGRIVKRRGGRILSNSERNGIPKKYHKKICNDYQDGISKRSLAKEFNKDICVITKILADNNIIERTPSEAAGGLPVNIHKAIGNDYINGMSTPKIAKNYSVSDTYICNILRDLEIERRDIKEARALLGEGFSIDDDQICNLYNDGYTTPELVEKFGGSVSTALRILRENNIQIRENICSDSVQSALKNEGHFIKMRDTDFYIYNLDGFNEHLKIGISFDHEDRKKKTYGIYTNYELVKTFTTRHEAYFLEQAILNETIEYKDCPRLLLERIIKVGCSGSREIRKLSFNVLEEIFNFYLKELEELKIWLFAAKYVPMTKEERKQCLNKCK